MAELPLGQVQMLNPMKSLDLLLKLFNMDGVELVFDDGSLEATADLALDQGTGARGLRTILEKTLLDVMYELPTMKGVTRCTVDANAIKGVTAVSLENNAGPLAALANREQLSA